MPNPLHHLQCPRCKGEGFYLRAEGRGYNRDGSFSHNQWEDCTCASYDPIDRLPKPLTEDET